MGPQSDVLLSTRRSTHTTLIPTPQPGFESTVSWGLLGVAAITLCGSIIDLGTLWLMQRSNSPQWEFVAISRTLQGLPGLLAAFAFLLVALHLRRSKSILLYRAIGTATVLLGLAGAALGAVMLTDFLVLRVDASTAERAMLWGATLKAVALGAVYLLVLVPAGVLQLRRPRSQ